MAVMFADTIRAHDCKTADEGLKSMMGCDAPLPLAFEYEALGFKFNRCPNWYVERSPDVYEYLEIWNWREKGYLPNNGSWLDLPNKICEALGFLDHLVGEKAHATRQRISNQATARGQGSPQQTGQRTKKTGF